jgi:hypothetical protein
MTDYAFVAANQRPTRRQIIFNWLMAEPDFATKIDGYWGTQKDVDRIDELLAALDAYASHTSGGSEHE